MKLFIELEIGQRENPASGDSWLHFASSLASDLLSTGLENLSEPSVAEIVGKLVSQSDKIFMLVSVHDSNEPAGCLGLLVSHLGKAAKPVMIVITGEHKAAEIILGDSGIPITRIREKEMITELIREFAQ